MNCESKICVLENVQTVNSVCHINSSEKNSSGLFFFLFFLLVVIFDWITSRFKSPLKLNMYTVCIK